MGRFWATWVVAITVFLVFACGATTHRSNGDGGAGGSAGAGVAGGSAAGAGETGSAFVDHLRQDSVTKMDLLLVVDNSISMGDKQALLAEALPLLVQRLVTPRCMRDCTANDDCSQAELSRGIPTGGNADVNGQCPLGRAELTPLRDLHVGVITSSLGSRGAMGPKDVCVAAEDDDHAHLLGQIRALPGTWNQTGFLAWDPDQRKTPPGDRDATVFVSKFGDMVQSAGEHGCGYEGTLEAWYRFLVDPEPPSSVVVENGKSGPSGIDSTILAQRAAFLRPDSLVAIVMLTDENDCSIIEEGLGFTVSTATPMARGTSQCASNPNDACCQSCGDAEPNAGCPAFAEDVACAQGTLLERPVDDLNLRCWQQKARFGMDLLYPVSRYVEGLTAPAVAQRSTGQHVQNPLFASAAGAAPRDPSLVFLVGIVGVPWQDIADEQSLVGPGLRFLSGAELTAMGRWEVILGEPAASPPIPPSDPLMFETPEDRTTLTFLAQRNPVTGDQLAPSTSNDPQANPINGHEQQNLAARDLQYACTFPLRTPRSCDQAAFDADQGCDCFNDDLPYNRPLCQPPNGGPAGITQYFAKAYPGLRHLHVLRELGDGAIVASVCPKVHDSTSPDYGYKPAMDALIERARHAFAPRCLPRPLQVDDAGRIGCMLVEALPNEPAGCDCAALGRSPLERSEVAAATRLEARALGLCDGRSVPCESLCVCEIPQHSGADLEACQGSPEPPPSPGFCYLNAMPDEPNVGNPELLQACSSSSKRLLRFTGETPTAGAAVMVACPPPSGTP